MKDTDWTSSEPRRARPRRQFMSRIAAALGIATASLSIGIYSRRSEIELAHERVRGDAERASRAAEVARLGAAFVASHRDEARGIARAVEQALPRWHRFVDTRARTRLIEKHVLEPGRIARELERGDVMILEGWVLARSEAAAAIHWSLKATGS